MLKLHFPKITVGRRTLDSYGSVLIWVIGFVLVVFFPELSERKAGGDEITLKESFYKSDMCDFFSPLSEDRSSYACSAAILQFVGVSPDNAWAYGLVTNVLLFAIPLVLYERLPLGVFIISLLWALVRGLFLENLSKELIVGFVLLFCMIAIVFKAGRFGWIAGCVFYGFAARAYWLISLVVWLVGDRLLGKISIFRFVVLLYLAYLSVSIVFSLMLGVSVSSYRIISNENRVLGEEGSKTLILPWVEGDSIVLQSVDLFLVFFRLVFPVEAFLLSPGISQIMIVVVMPLTVWMCFSVLLRKSIGNNSRLAQSLVFIVVSFLVVQGLFEPDYGSFARHFSMLTPFLFAALAIDRLGEFNRH